MEKTSLEKFKALVAQGGEWTRAYNYGVNETDVAQTGPGPDDWVRYHTGWAEVVSTLGDIAVRAVERWECHDGDPSSLDIGPFDDEPMFSVTGATLFDGWGELDAEGVNSVLGDILPEKFWKVDYRKFGDHPMWNLG